MTEKEWLQQLKTGDEVYISGMFGSSPTRNIISRITPTRVFVRFNDVSEKPFRKSDGGGVGDDWYFRTCILMPTDSLKAAIKMKELKEKIRELWGRVVFPSTIPKLEKLAAFLEKYIPKKEE